MDVCFVHGKYHDYNVPVEGAQHSRQCACGQVQSYRPPIGTGVKFDDVLVDAADLRELVEVYEGEVACAEGDPVLLERVKALLD